MRFPLPRTRPSMRRSTRRSMRRSTLQRTLFGTLALTSLCLVGCAPAPAPEWTPPPPTSPTAPVFASNDEALAAATAAYGAFLSAGGKILEEGGADPGRIAAYVTADYLPSVTAEIKGFTDRGHKNLGVPTFDTASVVRYQDLHPNQASVDIYACYDVSALRVLDNGGIDVTPTNRLDRVPFQVQLVSSPNSPNVLLVNKEDVWPGRNFC
ncbi:hypothetical protein JF66_09195 [Cryobacterium sp. MLB-32]|uniref:hypothetical protein n=1 Tax=Cryobacterium sp. MLB-32 TaxID=1529318 RepID=UPI0004E68B6C|nr:hypothetical protein [Cryobacterium sp. MLB-32]KFF59747.1 hypothetical protein JF66_09195 [Cryobacterium sp. MLB-32]